MEIFSARRLTNMGLIAAIYVVATMLCSSLAYGQVQFRISEVLMLLCYFNKDYIISLSIGCLIVNLFSTLGMVDVVFGTLATVVAAVLIYAEKQGKSCSCVAFPGDIKCGDSWL